MQVFGFPSAASSVSMNSFGSGTIYDLVELASMIIDHLGCISCFLVKQLRRDKPSVQRGQANACFRGNIRRRAEGWRSPFAGLRQPPRDQSMLNRAGRDRNPRNAEIGHRAKAQNGLHQIT